MANLSFSLLCLDRALEHLPTETYKLVDEVLWTSNGMGVLVVMTWEVEYTTYKAMDNPGVRYTPMLSSPTHSAFLWRK